MLIAIVLATAVILGGVIVVAMGKGGELSRERPDLPVRTDFRSWSDVAGYRPPAALLGYHPLATERALALIARTIAERDAEIDWLRRRLAELQPERAGSAQAEWLAPIVAAPGADLVAEPGTQSAEAPGAEPGELAELAELAAEPAEAPTTEPAEPVTGPSVGSGFAPHQPWRIRDDR